MTDPKPKVSKVRHKRAQEMARQHRKRKSPLPAHVWWVGALTWSLMLAIASFTRSVPFNKLSPGQRAPQTVQAEVDFEVVDLEATASRQEEAANKVSPVFRVKPSPLDGHLEDWNKLVANLQSASTTNDVNFVRMVELIGGPDSLKSLPDVFTRDELAAYSPKVAKVAEAVWNGGIVSKMERDTSMQSTDLTGRIEIADSGRETELSDISLEAEAVSKSTAAMEGITEEPLTPEQSQLLGDLFASWFEPNLQFDSSATNEKRKAARESVTQRTRRVTKGTTLMEVRGVVSEQMIADLQAHSQKVSDTRDLRLKIFQTIGRAVLLAAVLFTSVGWMYLLQPSLLQKPGRIALWLVLGVGSLLVAKLIGVLHTEVHLFPAHMIRPLLPFALAPLMATILRGPVFGLAVGFVSSTGFAAIDDLELVVFLTGISITCVAAIASRALHKRGNLFRAGLYVGLTQALLISGASIYNEVPFDIISVQAIGAILSGILVSILVFLLVPIFEWAFRVTTDIRLLELSDMSHPLLTRLALEAPGTYHHSLMVAHLAQSAAKEIGANDLLVRVAAYYHDIGKMVKPEFFIENAPAGMNPHDDIPPSMSRLIIISHVKEGVTLAHQYKLPPLITDAIEQHHGTSIIQYFFHRARSIEEEKKGGETIRQEDYRYPGPKPASLEMGILLLADAIEAASRTIDKSKPGQIEGLVNDIVREKLNDGQLDLCGLTMAQLTEIRRSFIFSLNNMLHGRIAYPKGDTKDASEPSRLDKTSSDNSETEPAPAQ